MRREPPGQTGSFGYASSSRGVDASAARVRCRAADAPYRSPALLRRTEGRPNSWASFRGLMECVWHKETARLLTHVKHTTPRALGCVFLATCALTT